MVNFISVNAKLSAARLGYNSISLCVHNRPCASLNASQLASVSVDRFTTEYISMPTTALNYASLV